MRGNRNKVLAVLLIRVEQREPCSILRRSPPEISERPRAAAAMHIRLTETTCYEITSALLQKKIREKRSGEEKELPVPSIGRSRIRVRAVCAKEAKRMREEQSIWVRELGRKDPVVKN